MGWKFDKKGDEWPRFSAGMKPHLRRLFRLEKGFKDIGHAFTNVFVEAARLSAYHTGHIFMVYVLLSVIAIVIAYA